jgi:hypothetical protein
MLLEITKLNIKNEGFKRDISLSKVYVNTSNIISVSDYHGAKPFLQEEKSNLSGESFCLVRINNGSHYEDIIVQGTAEGISERIASNTKKGLIHG